MVDQVLCTCIWCLQKSNGQGKIVSQATRVRHKKNQNKTWSNLKNIPVQQRYLDTSIPAANIISTSPLPLSDNISMLSQININEEYQNHDIEMISDELSNEDQIKILENEIDKIAILEDEKDKEDEIEISEEEDEENEENEEDNEEEYNREYNENISEDLIKGLRLLKIKEEHNISEVAFDKILKVLEISRISLYKLRKLLKNIIPLKPILVDCCINSCTAFTDELINKNTCPYYVIAIELVNKLLRKREIQKEFSTSFPVDIMHGLFENIAPAMLRHWTSTFFKENQENNYDYILSSKIWTEIGNIMEKNKKNKPLDFGRPPINIQRYSASFKAEDWSNWVILYSLPLLQDYLSEIYINGWAKFVYAVKLCLKKTITITELTEINKLFCEFVTHYDRLNNSSQIPAVLISYHYWLHITTSIRNTRPA
ncbi:18548_t:CDS:2 [Funneliformis geosporum]|uniref:18548_t:CDS:1 n=1 Tax=Funneliformis geosporum TaxID=1117311 RepID=A0A9W4T3G0_9GLOM|nr:18548_t:CDS:2 [Funneliformis geosporum]